MLSRRRPTAILVLATLGGLGCASTAYDPPEWVSNPPLEDNYLYGIGSYVGALHREDNQVYAVDQARAMLSRNLSSRVVSDSTVRETNADSSFRAETTVNSDYVVQNSELVSTWVDYHGQTGRPGTVWVLMRIARK